MEIAKVIKVLKSPPKDKKPLESGELTEKNLRDELIEELLGVLMDATPAQVQAYLEGVKRGGN